MRPFVSISLVVLLLINSFGFYIAFVVKQEGIHEQMSVLLNEQKHGAYILFSPNDFKNITWTREGKEFSLHGKLYDVASIQFATNEVKVYVEEDLLENDLVAGLVSIFSRQSEKGESGSPLKLLIDHFFSEFDVQQTIAVHPPCFLSSFFFIKNYQFVSFISSNNSPPPDSLS